MATPGIKPKIAQQPIMVQAPSAGSRSQRQTRPYQWTPAAGGGLGLIPRRGIQSPAMVYKATQLEVYAWNNTMRLLSLLPDIDPATGMATWNVLRLACPNDGIKVVGVKESTEQAGDAVQDDRATAILNALWESLPAEIGGLQGLVTQLTLMGLFTGLVSLEAVLGRRREGVYRIWPVDSLTLMFGRDNSNADLTPYQRQLGAPTVPTGWKRLNPETFYWSAIDPWVDDPYGRAPYGVALTEVLNDIAMIQDLRDAIHHVAWPRLRIGFNFTESHRMAVEVHHITDPNAAADYVWQEFQKVCEYVRDVKADDSLVHDSNSKADNIDGGNFEGMQAVLQYLRQRVVMALKSLPTLMGINDGATQTYTSVEWGIFAAGIETLRGLVLRPILKAANLHFQTLGLPFRAQAVYEPIRITDAQVVANTDSVRIKNEIEKRDQGWIDQNQASIAVTGSGPVGPAPQPQQPGQPGPGGVPTPIEGQPRQDRQDSQPPKRTDGGQQPSKKPAG